MHNKIVFLCISICICAVLSCITYAYATDAPYPHIATSDGTIDWNALDMSKEYTLRLCVWPVMHGTDDDTVVPAFGGYYEDMYAEKKGSYAYIYNADGTVNEKYYLYDPQVYHEPVYGIAQSEGVLPCKTDGWIDANGDYIAAFNTDMTAFDRDTYRDGIAMSVFDNIDKFDSVTYTDSGIMVVEFTDTLFAYNMRRYGKATPNVDFDGDERKAKIRRYFLVSDGSGILYSSSDGTFAKGWKTIAGSRYYFKKDGYAATGRATIGGIRYTFDENGVCKGRYTGWTKSSKGYRYYYKGKMLKGYYRIGGTSYYFNEKGYAVRRAAA